MEEEFLDEEPEEELLDDAPLGEAEEIILNEDDTQEAESEELELE